MANVLTTKLVGEITGDFIIPAYQRGYRWDEEVRLLLDDLNEIPDGVEYCLQPIVVRVTGQNRYELIDGQQRLTTLFLILNYIRTFRPRMNIKYTIDYEIRTNSRQFLSSIDFENIKDDVQNIDEFFIKNAAGIIKDWFSHQKDEDNIASLLADKLNNKVKVIWYEIDSSENAVSLFTRLNIGKIPLTNAELVKAVFLSRNNGIDDERYQLEIATQWDNIENELHDDRFWAFITNRKSELFPTRIELLFDLIAEKPEDSRERLYTLFWFQKQIKGQYKEHKIDLWKLVIKKFQLLKEWYNNSELYHKVGYLIAVGQKSLYEIIKESGTMSKTDFTAQLDTWIAESIDYEKPYTDLSYRTDYDNIEKLLLLFNVISVYDNGDKSMRFPFDRHKNKRGGWSLEHIHAQQSEGLKTVSQWNEWLDLHVRSLKNIDGEKYKNLIEEIETRKETTKELFDYFFEKILYNLELEQNADYIHLLSNMALIGLYDNSVLNNSTFDVKRDKILEMDKQGDYIPICTRRVFLKYYTGSEHNQLHFWGQSDRDDYLKAMNQTLRPYLSIIKKEI